MKSQKTNFKLIENDNYKVRISSTFVDEKLVLNLQLVLYKPYPMDKLVRILKEQHDNVHEAFYDQFKDAHKWLLSPETSLETVINNSLIPSTIQRLKFFKLPICINYSFELTDLYMGNKLEKQLIIADCINNNNFGYLTEWTLILLEIIKKMRDDPYAPYNDLENTAK